MQDIALSLLLWIAANSSYPVAGVSPPPIQLLGTEELTALYVAQNGAPSGAPKLDRRIQGYYSWTDGPQGVIYLPHPNETPGAEAYPDDPSANPIFRERMLHELVHYAQHATGAYARFVCPAQGEFDAYRLGGIYLRQQGAADPLTGRFVWMRRFSAC